MRALLPREWWRYAGRPAEEVDHQGPCSTPPVSFFSGQIVHAASSPSLGTTFHFPPQVLKEITSTAGKDLAEDVCRLTAFLCGLWIDTGCAPHCTRLDLGLLFSDLLLLFLSFRLLLLFPQGVGPVATLSESVGGCANLWTRKVFPNKSPAPAASFHAISALNAPCALRQATSQSS